MLYGDLRPAIEAFSAGRNVMSVLRENFGASANNEEIIEVAYDLQAGSYIKYVEDNQSYWRAYCAELSSVLSPYMTEGTTVLDIGTGELTTLVGVATHAFASASAIYACDISFSRLKLGHAFAARHLPADLMPRLQTFVGSLFTLPLRDRSIDVVWTSHALEPNGGRERGAIAEVMRVTRRVAVLFEPSYENNSAEGQERMERLGYVRGLADVIRASGGELLSVLPLKTVSNPLNPTHAFIARPAHKATAVDRAEPWACPATRQPMSRKPDSFFSPVSRLAYPVVAGIPLLRPEHAVLASALE